MNATPSSRQRRTTDLAALLARWLLGGLFIYLGVSKVFQAEEFLKVLRQHVLLGSPAVSQLVAGTVPWLEILYGLLLLSGRGLGAAAVLGRWWLGALFIYMGLNKALPNPEQFLKLVRQYDLVTNSYLLNAIGAALPWFEVYCGVLLLIGVGVRGSALMMVAMLVPFTLIVLKKALTLAAAKGIAFCAVKFDCGCGAGEVFICHKLVENSVLLLLSGWLMTGCGQELCLRFGLWREKDGAAG
jgi:uncharacterized membrane protein YphA (DoxX/SURF4 family)